MKKNRGFTLVEVIVVAVLVAIIGTAATVLYSGYIKDTAQDSLETITGAAATSANAYYRRTGQDPTVPQLNLFLAKKDRYVVTINSPYIVVKDTVYNIADSINFTE